MSAAALHRHTATLLALAATAAACGDARTLVTPDAHLADASALDGPPDATPALDASLADASVQSDPDAGAAPDASRLTARPLLGRTALTNRLLDPQLEPTNLLWQVPNTVGWDTVTRLTRLFQPDAPSAGPVLRVSADRQRPSALATEGIAVGRPLDARVWVGHHADEGGVLPEVVLSGTHARGEVVAVTLVPRERAVFAAESNVEWVLYEGRWSDAPVGELVLTVFDEEPGLELFVTGAEVVDAPLERRLTAPLPARARPLTPRDLLARDAVRRAARDRRTPPIPLPRPRIGEPLRSRRLR